MVAARALVDDLIASGAVDVSVWRLALYLVLLFHALGIVWWRCVLCTMEAVVGRHRGKGMSVKEGRDVCVRRPYFFPYD